MTLINNPTHCFLGGDPGLIPFSAPASLTRHPNFKKFKTNGSAPLERGADRQHERGEGHENVLQHLGARSAGPLTSERVR